MTNTEPLDLDGFDVHKPEIANSHGQERTYCGEDGQHWPCREALIAEVRRLRGLVPRGWEYGVMPAHTTEYAWPVFKTFAEAEDWRASIASEPIHEGVRVGRRVPAAVEGAWEPAPTDEETR